MPEQPITIESPEHACEVVRTHAHLRICGGGTKPGLRASSEGAVALDMRKLSGILEYEPDEYVFTARAGTPLKEIADVLDRAGQYLPFDPPFVNEGATLGGCIASGIAGPGRFRFGGVRDFIIGVRFVDGSAKVIKGGGKVVKNAAGFEFPKLMVGSLGRLALLTEASFKVFPKPEATLVATTKAASLADAVRAVGDVAKRAFDLDALELTSSGTVAIRVAGIRAALQARLDAIIKATGLKFDVVDALPALKAQLRIPLTLPQVPALDAVLERMGVARHYSVAGNVAWVAWPESKPTDDLDAALAGMGLSALHLNDATRCRLGSRTTAAAERVVKQALDPQNKFGSLP